MAKGLDVGTMNIICAEKEGDDIVFIQQRDAFIELEFNELTQKMLNNTNVLYIAKGNVINVLGDDALNFANIFNKRTRRPMRNGIISPEEKSAIPMVKLIIEKVVGEPNYQNEKLYLSSPANPIDSDIDTLYHQKTLESILRKIGYDARTINEGMAIIYSELADNGFSGLGISLGAGMTNVALGYYATPVLSFSLARGGDWIDQQTARATGLPVERICTIKEKNFKLSYVTEMGSPEGALAVYHNNLISYVINYLKRELTKGITTPDISVPVVLAGGTAMPAGFTDQFRKQLHETDLPINISRVILANDPLFSVARGCLIAATTEEGTTE
ncbi:MAG TPA: hypothetical protein EYP22_10570 [Methanosarcinales archaeon]|nr:hypothetical protein [Methanosarcinales archaeon]